MTDQPDPKQSAYQQSRVQWREENPPLTPDDIEEMLAAQKLEQQP